MDLLFRLAVRAVALFLILAAAGLVFYGGATLAAAQEAPASAIEVVVEQGLLTVHVRNAPLADVLRTIGERVGLSVTIRGDVNTTVTHSGGSAWTKASADCSTGTP